MAGKNVAFNKPHIILMCSSFEACPAQDKNNKCFLNVMKHKICNSCLIITEDDSVIPVGLNWLNPAAVELVEMH